MPPAFPASDEFIGAVNSGGCGSGLLVCPHHLSIQHGAAPPSCRDPIAAALWVTPPHAFRVKEGVRTSANHPPTHISHRNTRRRCHKLPQPPNGARGRAFDKLYCRNFDNTVYGVRLAVAVGETTCFAGLRGCRMGEGFWASKRYLSTAFETTCSHKILVARLRIRNNGRCCHFDTLPDAPDRSPS